MGIQKLEGATARALRAAQTLTDPASVIKELVDNGLDANATSIIVEVHANTLDLLLVKDNGHGIAPEDRPLAAIAGCTSKIIGLDDLEHVGGASLGFRGQALASIAEMSGSMTITTHVEGEPVAAVLTIARNGSILSQETAPLPIGTTIKITDFLKSNPVRRLETIKNADKSLRKIKRLMQDYAFARPQVRLALRVHKAKSDKVNFVFAPQIDKSIMGVATKVVGAPCSSQCEMYEAANAEFTITALLARPNADLSKITNIGAFVSVDTRPVSPTKGIFKQLVRTYRSSLMHACTNVTSIKDPFIHIDIACPDGAYDPNVEPAKDDLLFADPDIITKLFDKVLTQAYGSLETAEASSINGPSEHINEGQGGTFSDTFSADPETSSNALDAMPRDERVYDRTQSLSDDGDSPANRRDISISNPWMLAKLHTTIQTPSQRKVDGLGHGFPHALPTPIPSSSPWERQRPAESSTLVDQSSPLLHGSSNIQERSVLMKQVQLPFERRQPMQRIDQSDNSTSFEAGASSHVVGNSGDQVSENESRIVNKPFKPPTRLQNNAFDKLWSAQSQQSDSQRLRLKHKGSDDCSSPSTHIGAVVSSGLSQTGDIRNFGQSRMRSSRRSSAVDELYDDQDIYSPDDLQQRSRYPVSRNARRDDDEEGLFISDDEMLHNSPNKRSRPILMDSDDEDIASDAFNLEIGHNSPRISGTIPEESPTKASRSKDYLKPLERILPSRRVHNLAKDLSASPLQKFPAGVDSLRPEVESSTRLDSYFAFGRGTSPEVSMKPMISPIFSLQEDEIEVLAHRLDELVRERYNEKHTPPGFIQMVTTALRSHISSDMISDVET